MYPFRRFHNQNLAILDGTNVYLFISKNVDLVWGKLKGFVIMHPIDRLHKRNQIVFDALNFERRFHFQ